ncbi:hypothetical protein [Neorhodopirellula lusitana]|uniref:hypothetical protein n=1 Tax=Neorhodopirellula lusitana TaxID=445327 RepID=UPI0038514D1B
MNQSQRSIRQSASNVVYSMIVCGFAGSSLLGCGVDAESLQTLQRVSMQQSQITNGLDGAARPKAPSIEAHAAFQPQFPDRVDPFHVDADMQQVSVQSHGTVSIQVLGFADMGKQQAILRVGGDTKFVVAGDRIGNVEVISISPPRVRLRNDNLTWDASMFQNQPIGPNGAHTN